MSKTNVERDIAEEGLTMPKFPIVYGVAAGILLAYFFAKFILHDNNMLLFIGCFVLALGTLVALFEIKEPTCPSGVKSEVDETPSHTLR